MTRCNMSKVSMKLFFCTYLLMRTGVKRYRSWVMGGGEPEVVTRCNMSKVSKRPRGLLTLKEVITGGRDAVQHVQSGDSVGSYGGDG